MITVKIENSYTDGHESESRVEIDEGEFPLTAMPDEDWWQDYVFDHTGDGHYVEVYEATGERLGSCYTATIVHADDDRHWLVGATHDWLD
jgi:hypothetical protein